MSEHLIVASFDSENAAYEAADAIRNLRNMAGADFRLKAGVMLQKDKLGNVRVLDSDVRPPFGTIVGTAVGALIGLLAGPAGAAAGAATGAGVGAAVGAGLGLATDAVQFTFDDHFVESVKHDMRPGTTSLLLDAGEDSTSAVDRIVAKGHGRVRRQNA